MADPKADHSSSESNSDMDMVEESEDELNSKCVTV